MPVAAASTSSTASSTVINVVITVAVLVFILYRQLQVRRTSPRMILPLVLLVLGVAGLADTSSTSSDRLTSARVGVLIALLILDAGCLGAVRAWTVRLWRDGQQGVLRQGTWVTVVLWLAGLGIHEGVDYAAHIPASSTLLYLGVTFLAQRLMLQYRISRLEQMPGAQPWTAPAGGPGFPAGGPGPDIPGGTGGLGLWV